MLSACQILIGGHFGFVAKHKCYFVLIRMSSSSTDSSLENDKDLKGQVSQYLIDNLARLKNKEIEKEEMEKREKEQIEEAKRLAEVEAPQKAIKKAEERKVLSEKWSDLLRHIIGPIFLSVKQIYLNGKGQITIYPSPYVPKIILVWDQRGDHASGSRKCLEVTFVNSEFAVFAGTKKVVDGLPNNVIGLESVEKAIITSIEDELCLEEWEYNFTEDDDGYNPYDDNPYYRDSRAGG